MRLFSWLKSFSIPKMAISLPLALLAACILVVINETGFDRSNRALQEIATASQTRSQLNKLLQHMLDAETGQRGYLLTGDPRYLEPYDVAVSDIGQTIDTLRTLYMDDAEELKTFAQLGRNTQRKLAEMDLSVRMRKQGNEDAWKFVLMTDVGKEHMDAIRNQSTQLIASTAGRMELAQLQVKRSLQLSRIGIAAVAMAGLLAFYLYLRQTNALKQSADRPAGAAAARARPAGAPGARAHGHAGRAGHPPAAGARTGARAPGARTARRAGCPADGRQAGRGAPEVKTRRGFRRCHAAPATSDRDAEQRHCAQAPDH